jgi:hypothetical protein
VASDGHVCFFANTPIDVIVDINGWYASGSGFTDVRPARLVDTRAAETSRLEVDKSRVGGDHVLDVDLTGIAGLVPAAGVAAVSLNVTVADADRSGFLTVYPCGERPVVSSVNFVAGQVVANAVIAPVASDGHVCFFANTPIDVIVDINGWYASGSGFNNVGPVRLVDTRAHGSGVVGVPKQKIGNGYVLDVALAELAGLIPANGVAAVSLNVTVDGPEGSGFVTVYPCGQPANSSVNFTTGQTVANAVMAPTSTSGHICFFSNVRADVIVDINGWFSS